MLYHYFNLNRRLCIGGIALSCIAYISSLGLYSFGFVGGSHGGIPYVFPAGNCSLPNADGVAIIKTGTCGHLGQPFEYGIEIWSTDQTYIFDVNDVLPGGYNYISHDPVLGGFGNNLGVSWIGATFNTNEYCYYFSITGYYSTPGVKSNNVSFDCLNPGGGFCNTPAGNTTHTCTITDPSTFLVQKEGVFTDHPSITSGSINEPVEYTINVTWDWFTNDIVIQDAIPSNFWINGIDWDTGSLTPLFFPGIGYMFTWTHPGDASPKTGANTGNATITVSGYFFTGTYGLQINTASGTAEKYDNTPINSNDSANLLLIEPIHGLCGPTSGTSIYTLSGDGSSLTGGSSGLCVTGTVTGFVYNSGSHTRSWSCEGENGGSTMNCGADENRCGDGLTGTQQGVEVCDFSGSNNNENGPCSATCQWNTPSCTIVADLTSGTANLTVNATGTVNTPMSTGYRRTLRNRGTGGDLVIDVLNSAYNTSFVYTYSGSYIITAKVENAYNSQFSGTCSYSFITVNGTDGECGLLSGQILYDADNNGDLLTTGSVGLCSGGNITNFVYNTGSHTWSRSCEGLSGGSTMSCGATESRCGDEIIGTGVGYTGSEQCDLGTGNGTGGACSATCQ
ncbi:MAG TPA: hypothetical protein PLW93_02455, partial [Candidatus Absconditabacterales bacterium]|nr:hypothetical protein [Candidatus Absconditabacterales bacterium]HNG97110.1 hypothetical protein [Candidatus Absconditabacterales bacterium]